MLCHKSAHSLYAKERYVILQTIPIHTFRICAFISNTKVFFAKLKRGNGECSFIDIKASLLRSSVRMGKGMMSQKLGYQFCQCICQLTMSFRG